MFVKSGIKRFQMVQPQIASFASLRSKFLIETEELNALIEKQSPRLKVINATWYMPNDPRNAKNEHLTERITKQTLFFDHDEIVLPGSNLPHTLPTVEIFTKHMKELQVSPQDQIVCYDNIGLFSAPRAAWMFRYFGAEQVQVLNGGFKKWKAEGRKVESGP